MKYNKHIIIYIFISAVFLIFTAPLLFSDGMVMDGVLYATISRNLANGLGTFWKPFLSHTFFNEFYEHPPLAFGLQSLWFKVFGNSIYVERFYSLSTYVLTGLLIVGIWREFTNTYKTGWIPLLFYFSIPKISWACANNMLENTMTVFIATSVLFYLKSIKNYRFRFLIISGIALFLATLTKGFVGLYVWGLPLFLWLFVRKQKFVRVAADTILLIAITVIPLLMLLFFSNEASENLMHYFNKQVLGSIQNSNTVESRFFIVIAVIYHFLIPAVIATSVIIIAVVKKIKMPLKNFKNKEAFSLLLMSLGGILPITISMKQSGHYAITVYPFIAIAIGLLLNQIINTLSDIINEKSIKFKVFAILTYGIAVGVVVFSFMQVERIGYEKNKVSDCYLIIDKIGKNKTVSICPKMRDEYSLYGYFARYGSISLDRKTQQEYFVIDDRCDKSKIEKEYTKVELNTIEYSLYKKNK